MASPRRKIMAYWHLAALSALLAVHLGSSSSLVCPGGTTADEVLAGQDLTGKVAIVTGGDNGLGYATAFALAKRGSTIVIGNRNQTHGQEAAQEIAVATGVRVLALPLDLGSLQSVRDFAKSFLRELGPRLHILVNNAGIGGPSKLTADGFELVFQVDYLGHFLLTELLLPALRASRPARVVNVASGAHENACESAGWPRDCFKDWTYLPPPVVPRKNVTVHFSSGTVIMNSSSYGIAKFLNIQHAAELAMREREVGVEAFSLTPGFALTSMTSGFDPSDPKARAFCEQQIHPDASLPPNPCPFSAAQGAAAIAMCAAGKDALASGAYYSRTWACQRRPVVMQGFTEEMQHELYERSLHWAGRALGTQEVVV